MDESKIVPLLLAALIAHFLCCLSVVSSREVGVANVHVLPKGPTWPHRTVPYVMDKAFTMREKSMIWKAMKHFEDATCIHFRPRKRERGYVRIYKRLPGYTSGEESAICGSELGYAGRKPHILVLGNPDCFLHGRLLHEILHILGFPHEHSRSDRDQYIRIKWDNMPNKGAGDLYLNFKKFPGRYVKSGPYDYYSLLHYSLYSNSATGFDKTLVPTQQNVDETRVGQRLDFTHTDIKKVNKFYNCQQKAYLLKRSARFYQDADVMKLDSNVDEELKDAEMKDELSPDFWRRFNIRELW